MAMLRAAHPTLPSNDAATVPGAAVASASILPGRDLLAAVVQALPVGLTVRGPDGRCVIRNELATQLVERCFEADNVETRVQTLDILDETYTLETYLDVSDHRRIADELFKRAYLDDLTGLPNRGLLEQSADDLINTIEPGQSFALAFIDLDNFKYINDFYSHAAGDALLVKVAQRLSSALRHSDMLARVGGDEFVLLITPVADGHMLQNDIEALNERLKNPFFIDGHEIFASASIGVSVFPQHGRTYDLLRRNADSAMYRAKSSVKGAALMFDATMSHAATARMELEQRFRLAIRDRRFCCAYQPKVDIRDHRVVGLEVLLRWRDEQGVIQAPGEFVELAIQLGLINEITHLVLDETIRSFDAIDATFGPHSTISINVAAKQADDLAFMITLTEAIAASGQAARFMLELTEEAFFAKSRFQQEVLPHLRAMGVRVSIDDFGVGYSSLAALADITADEIKIDRSFITDIHKRPRSQIILRAIESLAHSLGMSIVAEGVETFEELVWLQASTTIHHVQGYYFSRPIFLDDPAERCFDFSARPQSVNRQSSAQRLVQSRASREARA